jgi:hypothetical protein
MILLITNTITTTTAMTRNIPRPIPALNMPSITSQEVNKNEIKNSAITLSEFIFFMVLL